MTNKVSSREAVEAQYNALKEKAASGNTNKVSKEEREKKYFTAVLPKGVKIAEKRIRILPNKDGLSPFFQQKFHEIQVDGKWLKIWDPAQEGKRSPLNEVREMLLATGRDEDRILARDYQSRDFFIVKLIDRDAEDDGPKFWRFKYAYKGDGVFDKIFPIYKNAKNDIDDPELGRDLIVTLTLSKSNNGKEYTTVTSVISADPSPLSEDKSKAAEWLADKLIWSDVYAKRDEEYLKIVASGEKPLWDAENKKFYSQEPSETTIGGNPVSSTAHLYDEQANEEPDDDLPF
jgi:hypothetical protein